MGSPALVTEKEFMGQVVELAKMLRWTLYHSWLSIHSYGGFPDLVLIKPPRLIVVELKREGKHPTERQREWLALFSACGVEAYCWVPSDWPEIERVLTGEEQ